jgi:hypothetical protein
MSSVNNFYVKKNLQVDGNLDVRGIATYTSTNINTTDLYVKDRYMVLNSEHKTVGAQDSGLISIQEGDNLISNATSFSTTATGTITFASAHAFAANDFINVTGNTVNTGLFEVDTVPTTTTLTIKSNPTSGYATHMTFTPETGLTGVNVVRSKISIIGTTPGGRYQSVIGNNTGTLASKNFLLAGDDTVTDKLILTGATDQIVIARTGGNGFLTKINTADPAGDVQYTIPDVGADSTFVMISGAQTLVSKSLTAPIITGGTAVELTSLSIKDTATTNFVSVLTTNTGITGNKSLTLNLGNADRVLQLGGNLSTTGTGNLELATTANSVITFPAVTDTAVTLDAVQLLTNKTMKLITVVDQDVTGPIGYGVTTFLPTGATKTATLPTGLVGQTVKVLNKATAASGLNVIVTGAGANTIEGETTFTLGGNQHASFTFVGSNEWRINF